MLRFATPEYLYLLLILPLLVGIYVYYRYRQRKLIAKFGDMELLAPLMRGYCPRMITIRFGLLLASIAILIVALARPQAGSKLSEMERVGGKIMLAVDVSNSMLTEDFEPNRLERTKYAIRQLLEKLEDEQIGMVVFAGDAYVQLPITSDYMTAQSFVRSLSPDMISRQGTSLQRAIEVATLAMPRAEGEGDKKSRSIVLITDGESHDDDPMSAANIAAEQGIIIHTIGIGTVDGRPIEINGEMVKDENGEIVVSKLDAEMLSQIAGTTGGKFVSSSDRSVGLDEIYAQIKEMEKSKSTILLYDEYAEQFFYLLYISLGLLILQFFLPNHKRKK